MVYIILDTKELLFKIGKTKDMKARLSTLGTANLNLQLIDTFHYIKEVDLHTLFKDKRHKKEWFNLLPEDVDAARELNYANYLEEKYRQEELNFEEVVG